MELYSASQSRFHASDWFLSTGRPIALTFKLVWLGALAVLACVEKLCSIMELVSVERDWVGYVPSSW
jgi:iron-regulated transporter 1